ncbi:MAG: glycosyltransferase, partial [Bacteroidota bacterium]
MKIAFCSIGSRGDIQPFLELGRQATERGHQVKVVSAGMYQSLAEDFGVAYEAFEGDYASLVDDEQMKKMIGKNPFTIRQKLREKVYPILENSLHKFYEAAQWAEAVVYHPKTLIDSFGQQMPQKLMKAYVVPAFTPTAAFRNPLLAFLPLPPFLNKFSYRITNALMGTVGEPIKHFRQKHQIQQRSNWLDTPAIYGISSSLIEHPTDYPSDHYFTGLWLSKPEDHAPLPSEWTEFLSRKTPTLIITFGSMPYQAKIPIKDFIQALIEAFDLQVLLVRGWGLKDAELPQHERVLAIERAPFDQLFPLADYVLHHGGAGTTATALQAGLPQMVCPVLHPVGDQYWWGKQLARKGLGVNPVPLKKLRVSDL